MAATPLDPAVAQVKADAELLAALTVDPESQRRVLEMAYYRGLSQSEIADELETPLGTVKSWARRGLLSLRESLAPLAG